MSPIRAPPGAQAGRPTPSNLEIQIIEKFKRFDSKYADENRAKSPLRKPVSSQGSSLAVSWIGLNPDPRKVKFMAKQGLFMRKLKKKDDGCYSVEPAAAEAKTGTASAPVEAPAPSAVEEIGETLKVLAAEEKKAQRPARSQSAADLGGRPAQQEQRRLSKMSSARHFLEQTTGCNLKVPGVPQPGTSGMGKRPLVPGVPELPKDLRELLYSGTTAEYDGRYAYLKARTRLYPQDKFTTTATQSQVLGWRLAGASKLDVGLPRRLDPKPGTLTLN